MAKLVQKSGYIKSGKASGYMRYIATREGVEKLAGNSAVTKGQRELIQKLLHDFPDAVDLFEYEDYCKTPTLGTASAFISNINFYGIVILLRKLRECGIFTEKELRKIAARIAADNGVEVMFFL